MNELQLRVQLALTEKILKPLKAITSGSSETANALKAAKDQLKELNRAQDNISAFQKVSKDASITANTLKSAQAEVKRIRQEIDKVPVPTRDMARAFKEAKDSALKLKQEHNELIVKQQRLRDTLKANGIATGNLNAKQKELKSQMALATGEVNKQSEALQVLNKRQQALHAARANYDKTISQRDKLAMAGATTTAAGVAMSMPILKAIKDYASFEDAMLGVARQVDGAKDANGNYTKSYYEMGDAIKAMSERLPMTSIEFANIVEAAARMGIQGKSDLLTFAETAAKAAIAFDLPVDELSDQMGKIAALYKVPIKNIGQLGDVINFLDDNAQSKGGDIINVMQRIAGTADSVGMKYREAAALASTFLSLGANSEVSASASNAMMTNLSIATMQSKKFQEGLAMLRLDAKGVQLGMSKDATGTILKVMDAIKSLPQEKQLEATTRLFGKEFGDDAAKLASNLGEYRRQLELVNDAKANGSMDREALTRTQALSAQYDLAKNSLFNMSSDLGLVLKPALVDILGSIKDVLRGMRDWVKEHPELTANLMKTAAVIAGVVTVVGGLMLAIAAVLGPFAILKFTLAVLPIKGMAVFSMLKTIGTGLLWLGRLLFMNPLGLAITALAVGALLIYKYWSPIKTFFVGLWDGIASGFTKMVEWIRDKLSFLKPLLKFLPGPIGLALSAVAAVSGPATAAPIKFDTRPPVMSAVAKSQHSASGQIVQNIYPSAGMDEKLLARYVGREFERIDRNKAAQARSRLTDKE